VGAVGKDAAKTSREDSPLGVSQVREDLKKRGSSSLGGLKFRKKKGEPLRIETMPETAVRGSIHTAGKSLKKSVGVLATRMLISLRQAIWTVGKK